MDERLDGGRVLARLPAERLRPWCAAVAGTVTGGFAALLGSVFAGIGTSGRAGSIATAAAVGLLAADAYRRAVQYPTDGPMVVGFACLAIAAVLCVAVRTPRQVLGVAAWTVPAGVVALGSVSAPGVLEQFLVTGGL